jgi:hypothetical protein
MTERVRVAAADRGRSLYLEVEFGDQTIFTILPVFVLYSTLAAV